MYHHPHSHPLSKVLPHPRIPPTSDCVVQYLLLEKICVDVNPCRSNPLLFKGQLYLKTCLPFTCLQVTHTSCCPASCFFSLKFSVQLFLPCLSVWENGRKSGAQDELCAPLLQKDPRTSYPFLTPLLLALKFVTLKCL